MGWLHSFSLTRATSVGVDPAEWVMTCRWADSDGQAIEISAPHVGVFELHSLVDGLLSSLWGPLDLWSWIATHS
jgi:hypothetical protein